MNQKKEIIQKLASDIRRIEILKERAAHSRHLRQLLKEAGKLEGDKFKTEKGEVTILKTTEVRNNKKDSSQL